MIMMINMITMTLEAAVAGSLLLAPPPAPSVTHRQPTTAAGDRSACRRAADLDPQASAGATSRVPSTLTPTGDLLQWAAATGDTLGLTLLAPEPGTYALSLFAVHHQGGPVISVKLWDTPLTRNGETTIALEGLTEPEVLPVRFDPVSLGPGRHILELTALEPGAVRIDCVALRRTGEMVVADGAGGEREGRPFLGVRMGAPSGGGVSITETIEGSAAAEAGLEGGDVILSLNGTPTGTTNDLLGAILRHRRGDRVELVLLRDGERLEKAVTLGQRSEAQGSSERAEHVIEVLDVRPGEVIADIGCGSGWLSEAIAKALAPDGRVYALEIDESHVRRLHRWSIPNLVPVFSARDDVLLPQSSLDTAMLHDVASHVDRSARPRFYASVARALKPRGKLVIFGPHGKARSMLDQLRQHGFVPPDDEALSAMSEIDLDERLEAGIVFRYTQGGGATRSLKTTPPSGRLDGR